MKICLQRVKYAKLEIDNKEIAKIANGIVVFVGFTAGDTKEKIDFATSKIAGLRIFEDGQGKMNLSASDTNGSFLIIPNFTLYADCEHGFRPSFTNALNSNDAKVLFDLFVSKMKEKASQVSSGVFGADMQITQRNDGPVTIIIEK